MEVIVRFQDRGTTHLVRFTQEDTQRFARSWPHSTVSGQGWFEFDASSGELVDAGGGAVDGDGPDWLVFSEDCQRYARRRLEVAFTVLVGASP